jgi:hypothetical protein
MTNFTSLPSLSISDIALLIVNDWTKVHVAARPYLDAMFNLHSIKDMYYADTGRSIVLYFLNNASSWKGEVAKAVKAELKARLKR